MKHFSIFEIIMLVCFGAAWPVALLKSWRSRTSAGKSVIFLYIIFIGYLAGILHKICFSMDVVIALYILNALMVAADILLFYRNRSYMSYSSHASHSLHPCPSSPSSPFPSIPSNPPSPAQPHPTPSNRKS